LWLSSFAWQEKQLDGVPLKTPFLWHRPQLTVACAPVNLKAEILWSKLAFFQLAVVWHDPQFVPKLPPWLSSLEWHPKQLEGVPLKTLFLWHWTQLTLACAPVKLNPEKLWLKVAFFQLDVE
jgi:hypothetical protein